MLLCRLKKLTSISRPHIFFDKVHLTNQYACSQYCANAFSLNKKTDQYKTFLFCYFHKKKLLGCHVSWRQNTWLKIIVVFVSFLYYFGITFYHKLIVSNHLVVSHALSVDLRGKILGTLRSRLQWLSISTFLSCNDYRMPYMIQRDRITKAALGMDFIEWTVYRVSGLCKKDM